MSRLMIAGVFALLFSPNAFSNCEPTGLKVDSRLQEVFDCSLQDLVENFAKEDGNWLGDYQNDATSFGPEVLYQWGKKVGGKRYRELAKQTVKYQEKLITDIVKTGQFGGNPLDLFSGLNAYIACLEHAPHPERIVCGVKLKPLLNLVLTALAVAPAETINRLIPGYQNNWGIIAHSRLAYAAVRFYLARGGALVDRPLVALAANVMEKMEKRFPFDPDQGYPTKGWGRWDEANPLMAYAYLYQVKKSKKARAKYLSRAERLLEFLQNKKHLGDFEKGSAFRHSLFEANDGDQIHSIVFSAHMQFPDAMLEWFRATGDRKFLEIAEKQLLFVKDHFTLKQRGEIRDTWLGVNRLIPHFSHDMAWSENMQKFRAVAEIYCTGCAFYILMVMLKHASFLP